MQKSEFKQSLLVKHHKTVDTVNGVEVAPATA